MRDQQVMDTQGKPGRGWTSCKEEHRRGNGARCENQQYLQEKRTQGGGGVSLIKYTRK